MAFLLLNAFVVTYFLHLAARIPFLGSLRIDLIIGIAALIALCFSNTRNKLRLELPISRRLLMFVVYILISLPLVTWPGSVMKFNLLFWLKNAFFFFLVVGAVRTEKQLKILMLVFLSCQLIRVLEPLYLHMTEGYWGDIAYSHVGGTMSGLNRLSGAPHDVVNANQYAWVIVSTVPFLFYFLWDSTRTAKALFLAVMPLSVYALFLTGSRSGLLSFGVVMFGIVLNSRRRLRNAVAAAVLLIPVAAYLFNSADSGLQTRYLSLIDSSVAGADTKQGRIDATVAQLGSLSNNALFGNGLGTSGETNRNVIGGRAQITHNLYLEALQETGIVGFFLFMAYIYWIVKSMLLANRQMQTSFEQREWLQKLSAAVLVWMAMDLVYSLSCFGISSWEWYFFGGVATVCVALAAEREGRAAGQKAEAGIPV